MSTKTETPDLKLLDSEGSSKAVGVAARWPGRLTKGGFVPVSSYFMANYHRLRPHEGARGLSSAEAMVIIRLSRVRRSAFMSTSGSSQICG